MKRNIWILGLILGAALSFNIFFAVYMCYNKPEFDGNAIVGFAVMIVVFSLTFFRIRNFRDKQLHGVITFGNALKTGALIVLVASTLYVLVWLFCYYLFVPDFIDKYIAHALNQAAREGASVSELASKTQEMEKFRGMYRNPIMVILLTYMEVLPVGLVVALVSAFVLKRKSKDHEG